MLRCGQRERRAMALILRDTGMGISGDEQIITAKWANSNNQTQHKVTGPRKNVRSG